MIIVNDVWPSKIICTLNVTEQKLKRMTVSVILLSLYEFKHVYKTYLKLRHASYKSHSITK